MRLGIFAKTFDRPTLDETLTAVRAQDLDLVQFNLSCAGMETLPSSLGPAEVTGIRDCLRKHNVEVAALSGTFNAIHPDVKLRREGIHRCRLLIGTAPTLDV